MVNKKMYGRVQNLKKKGYGTFQIAKRLKLDPATVRKYYHMGPCEYTRYLQKTKQRKKAFGAYREVILDIYKANHFQHLNMAGVYDYLEEKFSILPGSEKSFRNYIHYLEEKGELRYKPLPRQYTKVPELPFGKQMQLDFGVYKKAGQPPLYIFAVILSASRYKYAALQKTAFTTEEVINHLLDCFDYFEGVPEEIVIDQDSLLVVDENHGEVIYTKKFKVFLEEMGLRVYVCRKADPESKGKIENLIKYIKYNFLQPRTFTTIEEAQESLRGWLHRRANGKISQATGQVPLIAIEEERHYLRPVKNSIYRKDSFLGRDPRAVSDKGFIMVDSNEYSVPQEYRGQEVEIFKTDTELYVFAPRGGQEIARHVLIFETGKRTRDKKHFRNNSKTVEQLKQEVLGLFNVDKWKEFTRRNHTANPRYVRDQCLLAQKYFGGEIEQGVLEMAIDYCLDNKTYSMTALRDTYAYQLREFKADQETVFTAITGAFRVLDYTGPTVSNRPVQDYQNLIFERNGCRE